MFILSRLIISFVGSSGSIKIGDSIWRHVNEQFGVSQEDCEHGFRPLHSSTPKPKEFKRSFGFQFTLNSSDEEIFKPYSAAIISHMIDNDSSKCRFMLKTSDLGARRLLANWVAFNAPENQLLYKIQVLTYLQPKVGVFSTSRFPYIMMRKKLPMKKDKLLLLVLHWLLKVSPPFECNLLPHHFM